MDPKYNDPAIANAMWSAQAWHGGGDAQGGLSGRIHRAGVGFYPVKPKPRWGVRLMRSSPVFDKPCEHMLILLSSVVWLGINDRRPLLTMDEEEWSCHLPVGPAIRTGTVSKQLLIEPVKWASRAGDSQIHTTTMGIYAQEGSVFKSPCRDNWACCMRFIENGP